MKLNWQRVSKTKRKRETQIRSMLTKIYEQVEDASLRICWCSEARPRTERDRSSSVKKLVAISIFLYTNPDLSSIQIFIPYISSKYLF